MIRMARADELDAVACLWRESALAMDGPAQVVPDLDAMRRRIEAELRAGWELHVAALGPRLVGMLAIKSAEAWLDQIFVRPGEQGQGVGRALMSAAKSAMPSGFELRTASGSARAGRFYEQCGLTPVREGLHPWTQIPVTFYSRGPP
jgi:GNAT superfamily N-acetyltransferase